MWAQSEEKVAGREKINTFLRHLDLLLEEEGGVEAEAEKAAKSD